MVMIPQKDFMIRGVLKEYAIRFAFGSFKTLAQTAILRHDTDPAAARLLAGALCSGALISVLLDDEERYSVRLTYPGPVKGMILDISAQNGLRGFIQNPHVMTEAHDLDSACGSGCTVSLTKSLNGKILNSGQTESAFIEPEAALSYFFSVSDQIETEIRSEIRFRPDPAAPVECAAAVMLQALPECDLDVFNKIRERLMDDASGAVLAETGVPDYKPVLAKVTRRALAECNIDGLDDALEGPTAVIMTSEDYLEPTKVIYEFSKANDFYKIKGGVIDGKVMTAEEIITLAKLPSRQELLSMLAGGLLANISKFAVALEQVRLQKETE